MKIIGRERELKFLKEKYCSQDSEFILVYGRRRLGKTFLLKKSLEDHRNSFYFLLDKNSPETNLENFKEALAEKLNKPIISSIETSSWSQFFKYANEFIPKNFIFVFDEVPYLFEQKKAIISEFQKIYDEYIKENNSKIVLCGSSFSIMDEISSYHSPLYGRRTGRINLEPFTVQETQKYLGDNDIERVFKYHLILGGVPYYLRQIDVKKTFQENIDELFFSTTSIFIDEITFLLKEEFREIRSYITILKAIAQGKNTYTQIANTTQLNTSSLYSYLISLEKLKIISPKKSFFDKQNSKKTRYVIEDNFIFIWFNVFEKYSHQIVSDNLRKKIVKELIPSSLGYLFEKECRRILGKYYEKLDVFFDKEVEIDLIGKLEENYDIYECKFQKNINDKKILQELDKKSSHLPIIPNKKYIVSINKGITLEQLIKY